MKTNDLPPAEALAAALAHPNASIPAAVLEFARDLVTVEDVTHACPPLFCTAGGQLTRRLFSCTSRDRRTAVLSAWATKDDGARGVLIVGGVHDLPTPAPPTPPAPSEPPRQVTKEEDAALFAYNVEHYGLTADEGVHKAFRRPRVFRGTGPEGSPS